MLFQVDETKELFVANQHYRHTVVCIIDLMEVEETVPEFMKRVGLTKYLTAFNTCEQIKITKTSEQYYNRLKDSIFPVISDGSTGFAQAIDDGKARVFIRTKQNEYYHFDMVWEHRYRDIVEILQLISEFQELVTKETLLWNM